MGTTVDIGNEDHTILIIFFWVTSIFPCYDRGFIKHRRPENSPSTTQILRLNFNEVRLL